MRKVTCILLLAVICICAISLPLLAQTPTTNWPKFQRDSHNSGRSPATAIAMPYLHGTTALKSALPRGGFAIDPDGYVYATVSGTTHNMKMNSTLGTAIWDVTTPSLQSTYSLKSGPTLFDNGLGSKYVLVGPGTGYPTIPAPENKMLFALDPDTGAVAWSTDLLPYYPSADINYASPIVGPDGTIYTHLQNSPYDPQFTSDSSQKSHPLYGVDPTGPIIAVDPVTHNVKWTFGIDNHHGIGFCWGTFAWKVVGGHTRLFVAGECDVNAQADNDNVMAIDDYGDHAEFVWGANAYMHDGPVSLSNDGNTVYVGCADTWRNSSSDTNNKRIVALDADTGAEKWTLNTNCQHVFPPTIGSDGTLYVAGVSGGSTSGLGTSMIYPYLRSIKGRITAIQDNGTSASVKWYLDLPDDFWNDCSNLAVTSGNPSIIYVGTGLGPLGSRGRLYAIADMGDHAKIIWTYQCIKDDIGNWCSTLALADNGDLYVGHYTTLCRFPAGFDVNNPNGISGYVKDSDGNPIAGAWVAAQKSPHPLADNNSRIWTSTNSDGYYHLGVVYTGTYYVAAAASDYGGGLKYEPTDDQVITINALTDVNKIDFTLGASKYNWAPQGTASTETENSSAGYKSANAIDGSYSTEFRGGIAPTTTAPTSLTVDLGESRNIGEALIYWDAATATQYEVDYSTDNATWNTVYLSPKATSSTGINQNTGFPLDWYTSTSSLGSGGQDRVGCDVIKFDPVIAQYWRVLFYGKLTSNPTIWELELRDATMAPHSNVKSIKSGQDGDLVEIGDAIITGVTGGGIPSDTFFIESTDRTTGVSATTTADMSQIGFGDKVSVTGTVATDANGNKYINATSVTRKAGLTPIDAIGMNNSTASQESTRNLFVKTWGKVGEVGTDYFTISDGSTAAIKVFCGSSMSKPSVNDVVRVRGITSKDSSGPVLYMRNERADWTSADATYQPLPFAGAYKYPRQYLVLGPFRDSEPPLSLMSDWLQVDFISAAGCADEWNVRPSAGDTVGDKTWITANASDGKLDIGAVLGGVSDMAVAYVNLYVWSETEAPAVAITTGSDDWLLFYVNGVTDYNTWMFYGDGRNLDYGSDAPVPITLHQGLNSLLFKVCNGGNGTGFGFNCQFIDNTSTVLPGFGGCPAYSATGLGYTLNNETP